MKKSNDLLHEAVRAANHPFRQTDSRPTKPQKHRYERRKIREIIRGEAWLSEET